MAKQKEPDLFGDEQPDLFGADAAPPAYRPDPDKVRRRLERILVEVRAAERLDWGATSLYRTIFPQMALWLPDDEARQLCLEFEAEMERLAAA